MVNIINKINKIDSPYNCKLKGKMKKVNYSYWVVHIIVEILTVCTCYHKILDCAYVGRCKCHDMLMAPERINYEQRKPQL